MSTLTSFFAGGLQGVAFNAAVLVFTIIQDLTVTVIKFFNYLVFVRVDKGLPVVTTTWGILRDFSNMLFILALVWMAFATIFDVSGKGKFQESIVRFVIVAILINFSLVIGGIVIDGCQVLTNVFLSMIGDPAARIGQYLNPTALLQMKNAASAATAADITSATGFSLLFYIILSAMFLFSILVATAFAFIRVFAIWGLLIVSPMAWMANILPGTKKWFVNWWSAFLGWNLFLPIYLFFMYIGLVFLSQQNKVVTSVLGTPTTGNALTDFGNSLTFNLIFFYIFAAGLFYYGAVWAQKVTSKFSFGSEQFQKGLGWAKWSVKNFPTPYVGSLQNYEKAIGQRKEQFQREGVFGYLGSEKSARQTARIAQQFGVREAKDKQLSSDVSTWKSRFSNLDTNQLRAEIDNGPIHQQLARRELLKDRGQLSNAELENTFTLYRKTGENSALRFANSVDYNKLSPAERDSWFNRTSNIELRKKIANSMAEKGDYNTHDQVIEASTLFTSQADRAAFIRKAAKRLDSTEVANILTTLGPGATREERAAISEVLADKGSLDGTQILATYNMLGPGSEEGEKFIGKIKFDSLDRADRDVLYNAAQGGNLADVEVAHKLYKTLIDKEEFNTAKLRQMVDSYRTPDEKKELLKEAQKKDFIGATEVRFAAGLSGRPGAAVLNINQAIQEQVDRMKVDDLAEIPPDAKGWGDPRLRAAVENRMRFIQGQQGPQPPVLLNPNLPFNATTNPIVTPGKPGAGAKLKQDLLDAIKGDRRKIGDINSLPNL